MVNELFQSSVQVSSPIFVRWHVVVADSWPNVTPKGFQVSNDIQVFGVVVWEQDNGLFGIK